MIPMKGQLEVLHVDLCNSVGLVGVGTVRIQTDGLYLEVDEREIGISWHSLAKLLEHPAMQTELAWHSGTELPGVP